MAEGQVNHPIFARFYGRFSRLMEREVGPRRGELLGGLTGRVLEVGSGNGLNFAHYPSDVVSVTAVEPEAYLRALARQAAAAAPVPVTVSDGTAERLPARDGEFDAAVACLVLCSVAGQAGALGELRRVLRPGGELRFLEHVRSEVPRKARVQTAADRSGVWPWFSGGCRCSRETVTEIRAAGFVVERVRQIQLGPAWALTNPVVLGVARAPAG